MIKIFCFFIPLLLSGCYVDNNTPYIVFKNSHAEIINADTIPVEINSWHELLVESGSESHAIRYLMQKNQEDIKDITDSSFVHRSSNGWDGDGNFENVIIKSVFPDSVFIPGDVLRITVRFNSDKRWHGRSVFYYVN